MRRSQKGKFINMDVQEKQKKKRVMAGFGCFLAFMAVCTLITKGIYTSGMPKVTVIYPEQRTITHYITLQGRVRPKQEYGIYVQAGLPVETVYADRGEIVKAGTPLFQVRTEDLELLIAEAEADIRYQEALLADEAGRRREEQQEKRDSLAGMREDYDSVLRELDIAIEKKRLAYEAARQARERAEEAFSSVSGGDAGALESCELAESQAALEMEEAVIRKEEAIREWNRQYADMERGSYDAVAETVSVKDRLEQRRQSLEKLLELYSAQGVVCAEEAGFLVENRLRAGEYTPDTACMLFVKREDAGVVEFVLDEESRDRLSIGDRVDLEYRTENGEKKRQEGVISYVESRDGNDVAMVELPEAQLTIGQGVTLKFQFVTESYSTVISRQAIVEENSLYSVYIVEEQEGFLGAEQRIRKISVALTDSNLSLAAVESAVITPESRIVLSADRELAEGDVVRLVN